MVVTDKVFETGASYTWGCHSDMQLTVCLGQHANVGNPILQPPLASKIAVPTGALKRPCVGCCLWQRYDDSMYGTRGGWTAAPKPLVSAVWHGRYGTGCADCQFRVDGWAEMRHSGRRIGRRLED